MADLVVLDRDHMRVPEDDIRCLKPVLTMVDGRIDYQDDGFNLDVATQ